jgi:hypothetical protein
VAILFMFMRVPHGTPAAKRLEFLKQIDRETPPHSGTEQTHAHELGPEVSVKLPRLRAIMK